MFLNSTWSAESQHAGIPTRRQLLGTMEGAFQCAQCSAAARLDRNTLIVFFSDNRGEPNNYSNNDALRDHEYSAYKGGIRLPFLISCPGRPQKNTASREPLICLDILPFRLRRRKQVDTVERLRPANPDARTKRETEA